MRNIGMHMIVRIHTGRRIIIKLPYFESVYLFNGEKKRIRNALDLEQSNNNSRKYLFKVRNRTDTCLVMSIWKCQICKIARK